MKVYLSCSYKTPESVKECIKELLLSKKVKLSYYEKGTPYDDNLIRDADIICIYLDNNEMEANIDGLSMGIKSEVILSNQLNKRIILAHYNKLSNEYKLYATVTLGNKFKGIEGTSDIISEFIGEEVVKDKNKNKVML
jgi:hypothetical protein